MPLPLAIVEGLWPVRGSGLEQPLRCWATSASSSTAMAYRLFFASLGAVSGGDGVHCVVFVGTAHEAAALAALLLGGIRLHVDDGSGREAVGSARRRWCCRRAGEVATAPG
jgi:hypothetical protein